MSCRNIIGWIVSASLLLMAAFPVLAHDDIEKHRSCSHCGMDRKAYGYSRMLIIYADGSQTGICSLHCAVTELKTYPDKKAASLLVADRNNHELLDATKAFWVMGGRKRGVMTANPAWAFASQQEAQSFVHDYGGRLSSWDEVSAAAIKELPQ
ncbi:nosL protein [Geobacter sp. OR-1]|uniref:nitrous oxide reductase accessory protein NosL n=1 Tax=Geobacter sp. OR-1 TaxID=1266765 RepID=UPI000541AD17|nr:nitrous oxide reductase accessory protein NosL [Geobacter sp. OR-1]GAM09724.1 nosL protein [Geobacter sp. OR-1]